MSDAEGPVPPTMPQTPPAAGPPGPGWWMASDGQWYPPQTPPGYGQPAYGQPAGYGVPMAYVNPAAKSKLVAGILQIALGGLGIGRFYLGYTGIGVAQLLVTVFTCGIGAIWSIIDGIMILTGSVTTDANGVPLRD